MDSSRGDFPHGEHPIHYFYGFLDFVTIVPYGKEDIDSVTRIKMIQSTMTVVANNTNCPLPLFAQVMDRRRHQYVGVFSGLQSRTCFEMAVYPR